MNIIKNMILRQSDKQLKKDLIEVRDNEWWCIVYNELNRRYDRENGVITLLVRALES